MELIATKLIRFKICEHAAIVKDDKCMKFAEEPPNMDASEVCDANGKEGNKVTILLVPLRIEFSNFF